MLNPFNLIKIEEHKMKKITLAIFLLIFCINFPLLSQVAIKIDATKPWTDTGIDVYQNEMIVILAYGRYNEGGLPNDPVYWIGPAGFPTPTKYGSQSSLYPIPEAAARCLIGKIGSNNPFIVASKYVESVPQNGRLYLGLNDINFTNNDGYLVAYISKASGFARPIIVDITKDWTDTGLDVLPGDKVAAMGYGIYNEGGYQTELKNWLGPSGHPFENTSVGTYPIPDALARGIIGKIDSGSPFVVGDYREISVENSGRFYLGLNDIEFSNNMGYCIVFLMHNPITPVINPQTEINNLSTQSDVKLNFKLIGNYPNPFNPMTTIRYKIENGSNVSLKIFSVDGKLVRTLVNIYQKSGDYDVEWDGNTENGANVSSGQYFYRLEVDGKNMTGKALLIR